jgi:ATP-dependent Lhr-like helicase
MGEVRGEYPWLDGRGDNTLVATADGLAWWTFAGGKANAALAGELSRRLGVRASGGNFAVMFEAPTDPREVERELLSLGRHDASGIAPAVSDQAVDGLKFSECLPRALAVRVVRERLTDATGAAAALDRPTRVVLST